MNQWKISIEQLIEWKELIESQNDPKTVAEQIDDILKQMEE